MILAIYFHYANIRALTRISMYHMGLEDDVHAHATTPFQSFLLINFRRFFLILFPLFRVYLSQMKIFMIIS